MKTLIGKFCRGVGWSFVGIVCATAVGMVGYIGWMLAEALGIHGAWGIPSIYGLAALIFLMIYAANEW